MSNHNFLTERRALFCNGVAALGSINTNVVNFGAVAAAQSSLYAIGTTHVAPVPGSGNWINVVLDGSFGTTFKFNRRGIYRISARADETAASTTGFQLGITLDQALALYTVAAGTATSATSGYGTSVLDFATGLGSAANQQAVTTQADVFITDALAGGAQAAAASGVQGVGVVRIIANNATNGAIGTALILATYRASVVSIGDVAG